MGKTFKDKKVHKGQIQKALNEEERIKKEMLRKEAEEAKRWEDPKSISNNDVRKVEEEKQRRKEELRRKYEEEMNNL